MRALLSIIALYKCRPDLFDNMQIPAPLNRQALIDELCMELGELNLILTEPDILKIAIGRWSATRIDVWEHLYETTQYEYNPIWNKDGHFLETETRDLEAVTDGTQTRNLAGTNDMTISSNTAAYNSGTLQPEDQSITDQDTTDTGTLDVDQTVTDAGTITRERTEQGNIGLTSTQQLITEERSIADFSLYKIIIEEFKRRFCIMVY